jgi:hypothetical protein
MEATNMSGTEGWRIEWSQGITTLLLALMVLFIFLAGDNFPRGIFIAVLSVTIFLGIFVGSEKLPSHGHRPQPINILCGRELRECSLIKHRPL